jgi:hypothetical protein
MTLKEKASFLVQMFEFNGYALNQSSLEISKSFSEKAITLIIEEIDNQYQVNYWYEVLNEIEKL